MKARGFLLSTNGPLHNALKIKPPLVFNKTNTDDLLFHLDYRVDYRVDHRVDHRETRVEPGF